MKNEKKNRILKSTIIVTMFSIVIKIFGLLKQTLIASRCGASADTDAFYVSTGIIGQLSNIIFSALSVSLLSMYVNIKEKKNEKEADCLINRTIKVFLPISCAISILFYILSPIISRFIAPSFSENEMIKLVKYMKIMSFSFVPCFYYLIVNVVLESEKKFVYGKFLGLFQNLFIIISIIFLYDIVGVDCLVYAYLFSGIMETILVSIAARKHIKQMFKIKIPQYKEEIKKLFLLSAPLIVGSAVYEINDIIDKKISTDLGKGYASMLTFGATINDIISGIVISSIAVVLFSNFATWVAKLENDKVNKCLNESINILNLLISPITVICIVFNIEIAQFFYGHGNITNEELQIIGGVILGYAIGFSFQMYRTLFTKALYAFQDTKATMYNGIISIFINAVLSIVLAKYMGLLGVSLATSISMIVSTGLLYNKLKKYLPTFKINDIIKMHLKYMMVSIILGIVIYSMKNNININPTLKLLSFSLIMLLIYGIILYLINDKYIVKIKQIIIKFLRSGEAE